MAHQRSGDILIEVRLLERSGLDLLTLSSSHCDPTETSVTPSPVIPIAERTTGDRQAPSGH